MPHGPRRSQPLGVTAVLLITAIPYVLFTWNAVVQHLPGPHGDANHLDRGREVFIAMAFFVSLPINFVVSNILAITGRLRHRWHFACIYSALAMVMLVMLVEAVIAYREMHRPVPVSRRAWPSRGGMAERADQLGV